MSFCLFSIMLFVLRVRANIVVYIEFSYPKNPYNAELRLEFSYVDI